jgi:hypothetical protein
MTTRKPVLGNAARLLLLGATIAAAPILARCAGPSLDYSASVRCTTDVSEFAQRLIMPNVPNSLMCLENVAAVNDELFNTPVIDSAGYRVGHFRRLEIKEPGDLVAVITLNSSRRTISVLTDHVRYEPGTDLIITDLTTREMDRIPSGFPYG